LSIARGKLILFASKKLLFLMLITVMAARQAAIAHPHLLEISSPKAGTIVNPGQTISVTVTSPAGTAFKSVGVVGPFGISEVATALPASFPIKISADNSCGPYSLGAVGVPLAGKTIFSEPVKINVERSDMPVSLSSQSEAFILEAQGQQVPILPLATFADGSISEITECSRVKYQSTNTTVATVDKNGIATAGDPGSGSILVIYTNPNGPARQLSIPVTVLPPILVPTPNHLTFQSELGIQVGASASASITLTNKSMSDSQLRVKQISVSGDFTETGNCIASSPLQIYATCIINVKFMPTARGERHGTLTITSSMNGVPMAIPLLGFAR
jgi:hypothetical protein